MKVGQPASCGLTIHLWLGRQRRKVSRKLRRTSAMRDLDPVTSGFVSRYNQGLAHELQGTKSDYGSEGWGFESLRACQLLDDGDVRTDTGEFP